MNRPPLEVADIFRAAGKEFIEKSRRWMTWQHLKVLRAIEHCRTAALGGHIDSCSQCGHRAISFNSCRNRHCPKCQTNARDHWLAARADELLPVPYFNVVFTLPHELSALALQNKRVLYDLMFRASAERLLEIAACDYSRFARRRASTRYRLSTSQRIISVCDTPKHLAWSCRLI